MHQTCLIKNSVDQAARSGKIGILEFLTEVRKSLSLHQGHQQLKPSRVLAQPNLSFALDYCDFRLYIQDSRPYLLESLRFVLAPTTTFFIPYIFPLLKTSEKCRKLDVITRCGIPERNTSLALGPGHFRKYLDI